MAGHARESTGHAVVGNRADAAPRIDRMRPDEELPRLGVNHPIGRRAADALRPDDSTEIGRDLVELVGRASGQVGAVGDHPQPVAPRHDRSGTTLALVVAHRKVRMDPGDAGDRPWCRRLASRLRQGVQAKGHEERGSGESHA
jgi:hypothetical protein